MTQDIVKRLRTMPSSLNDAIRSMELAADRIEQLQQLLDFALNDARKAIDLRNAEIPRLRAEKDEAVPNGYTLVPKSALVWLFGEGPDADGAWFGDVSEATKMVAGRPARYWWRSRFRNMIESAAIRQGAE